MGGLCGEHGEGLLAAPGTFALPHVDPEAINPLGQPGHAPLGAGEGHIPPCGAPLKGGAPRLRAAAAAQEGIIGVAGEGRTELRRIASPLPQVLHKVQGNGAVQRGDRGAVRPPPPALGPPVP